MQHGTRHHRKKCSRHTFAGHIGDCNRQSLLVELEEVVEISAHFFGRPHATPYFEFIRDLVSFIICRQKRLLYSSRNIEFVSKRNQCFFGRKSIAQSLVLVSNPA